MQSIARYCDVPVLGILPKSKEIEIPDRHLGLIPAGEQDMLQDRISLLGNLVKAKWIVNCWKWLGMQHLLRIQKKHYLYKMEAAC